MREGWKVRSSFRGSAGSLARAKSRTAGVLPGFCRAKVNATETRWTTTSIEYFEIFSIILCNMSRSSTSTARPLSLTEELEKLEQSITLTLQEIDHNFSRAHRIVTSSILPIVEQYAEHSNAVWEGSKVGRSLRTSIFNADTSIVLETIL